jgi:TRAP transporter TAXI family solute receptor
MISELQKRMPLRILSFTSSEVASLTRALPYLSPLSLPETAYPGAEVKADTIALMAMLVCDARLSEDLVFRLCRDVYDHLEYLQKIHERARDLSLDNFMKGVPAGYIHPGAARFYNERLQQKMGTQ